MTRCRLEDETKWPGWFFMFVAAILLFATYACVQVHRHQGIDAAIRADIRRKP